MANKYGMSSPASLTMHSRQLLSLAGLVAELYPSAQTPADPHWGRLIVDSQLHWRFSRAGGRSWLYLPQSAPMYQLAGCTVVLAE